MSAHEETMWSDFAREVEPPRAPAVRADGRPLTVSASSLARFRECPRAWWYEAVLGLVRPSSPSAQLGTDTHAVLEHRIRTGEWPAGPGRPVNIARAGGATEQLVDLFRAMYLAGRLEIERKIEGQLGPLPFRGRIDLLGRPPHLLGKPSRFVGDWKTTSRPAARLAPAELRGDLQLGLYAAYGHGFDEPVTVAHYTLGTTGAPVFHAETVDLAPGDIRFTHAIAVELAERMVELAPVRVAEDVPENRASCSKWGGCPHAARCPAMAPSLFRNVPDSTPAHEVAVYDLAALLGAAPAAPATNPAPAAPSAAPAPAPAAPAPVAPPANVAAHHVSPPDATPTHTSPLAEAVAAVLRLGQWPGERIVASLAEEYAISSDDLRAAVVSAGMHVPAGEAPAAPAAPRGPTKAEAELAEDLAVARGLADIERGTPGAFPVERGSDAWWSAFRTARGVARVGKDRQARILAGFANPPPAGVAAPVSAPAAPAGSEPVPTPPALRDATDAERAEMISEAFYRALHAMEDTTTTLSADAIAAELLNPRPWLRTAVAVELAKYAMGRAARAIAARAEDAAEASSTPPPPDAPAPAPDAPAPVVPSPVLRVLLIDALSLAGSIPLRVFLSDAINAVEAAENRPIDLVDYGKGPALVAARVAVNPPKLSPGLWLVSASSSDKLTEAVLPVLAREAWLVVRGVR